MSLSCFAAKSLGNFNSPSKAKRPFCFCLSAKKAIFNEIFSFVGLPRQARRLMRTDRENFCISSQGDGWLECGGVKVPRRWNILKFIRGEWDGKKIDL